MAQTFLITKCYNKKYWYAKLVGHKVSGVFNKHNPKEVHVLLSALTPEQQKLVVGPMYGDGGYIAEGDFILYQQKTLEDCILDLEIEIRISLKRENPS